MRESESERTAVSAMHTAFGTRESGKSLEEGRILAKEVKDETVLYDGELYKRVWLGNNIEIDYNTPGFEWNQNDCTFLRLSDMIVEVFAGDNELQIGI